MVDTLQAIHPSLMWEYGSAMRQPGHRLVITPESRRFLRPMVRTILERAPKIAGWEFYPYRLAETAELTPELTPEDKSEETPTSEGSEGTEE
jgi:hypothetical protein